MKQNPMEQSMSEKRVPDLVLITEIDVIQESGITPQTKEDLARLVEAPLLEACEELYDKNINTVMSSANSKDVETGKAYIDIDFGTLSEENKQIALSLGESFMMHGMTPTECIKLVFNINQGTTVGDLRKMAHETVSKFKFQERIPFPPFVDPFEISQTEIDQQIRDIPALKAMLIEWQEELLQLEKSVDSDPVRLSQLRMDIPDLDWEIKRREELKLGGN